MKYKTQNGWTKASMIAHIKAEFKGRSTINDGYESCRYRGPNGKKCAVGMFIPDEFYSPKIEGYLYSGEDSDKTVCDFIPELLMLMPLENMSDLQQVHDGSHSDTTLQDMLTWVENNVE